MAQETFNQYSTKFLEFVEARLITQGENQAGKEKTGVTFFNTYYEGEVAKNGATVVNIPVDGPDPSIRDYDKVNGIAPEVATGENLAILIDGDHAINELMDGYTVQTVPAIVVARRLQRAAKAFAIFIDNDAISTLESSTNTQTVAAITKLNVYETILNQIKKGMEDNITFNAMMINPNLYTLLKLDPSFSKPSDMGMAQAKSGLVGFVDGIPIVVTNKMDLKTQFILVDWAHATRILAWKIEPFLTSLDGSKQMIGAMAIKGRLILKHKITNPLGVLVAAVA